MSCLKMIVLLVRMSLIFPLQIQIRARNACSLPRSDMRLVKENTLYALLAQDEPYTHQLKTGEMISSSKNLAFMLYPLVGVYALTIGQQPALNAGASAVSANNPNR